MTPRLFAPAFAVLLAAPAVQARPAHAPVEVRGAWSRPTSTPMGAGYLTLTNRGREPDRLLGASSPLAAAVSLHRSSMRNGIMSMQLVEDGLPLPPGATVRLEPGGYHLMLSGLKHPLKPADRVPLTLLLQRAGPVHTVLEVRTEPPPMRMP